MTDRSYSELRNIQDPEVTEVPPGQKMMVYQLYGYYGPYKIYADKFDVATVNC